MVVIFKRSALSLLPAEIRNAHMTRGYVHHVDRSDTLNSTYTDHSVLV